MLHCVYFHNDKENVCTSAKNSLSQQKKETHHRLQIKTPFWSDQFHNSSISLFGCIRLSEQYKNAKSPGIVDFFSEILLWHFRVIFIIQKVWYCLSKREFKKCIKISQLIILCALCMSPRVQWERIYSDYLWVKSALTKTLHNIKKDVFIQSSLAKNDISLSHTTLVVAYVLLCVILIWLDSNHQTP